MGWIARSMLRLPKGLNTMSENNTDVTDERKLVFDTTDKLLDDAFIEEVMRG